MKIIKYPSEDKSITLLSLSHPDRQTRMQSQIIDPLFKNDPIAKQSISYWAIYPQENESGYNTCEAYNRAWLSCNSPILLFTTGDIIISSALIWRTYSVLLNGLIPVALRLDETEEGNFQPNPHSIGDFIMVKRDWVVAVGGWDERLESWGFQDYDFIQRLELQLGLSPYIMGESKEDRVIHLWHPRKEDRWYRNQNKINQGIIEREGRWNKAMMLEKHKTEETALWSAV